MSKVDREIAQKPEKKQYHAPQLTEWGALVKITRGEGGSGFDEDSECFNT
jgi:hypothetical protein